VEEMSVKCHIGVCYKFLASHVILKEMSVGMRSDCRSGGL